MNNIKNYNNNNYNNKINSDAYLNDSSLKINQVASNYDIENRNNVNQYN
jgi:hypothetical protein